MKEKMNRKTISKVIVFSKTATLSNVICADDVLNCHAGELLLKMQNRQGEL